MSQLLQRTTTGKSGVRRWTTGTRGLGVGLTIGAVFLLVLAPIFLGGFGLDLLGRYLALAMVAVGIGLVWGRGGMLALGQGVYFGLGAYVMAMHMTLADTRLVGEEIPEFMRQNGVEELPFVWSMFGNPVAALIGVILVPAVVAAVLGYAVFARRIKGAYFAILSQALAAAFAIWIIGQPVLTNGSNGLSNFDSLLGYDLNDSANRTVLYLVTAVVLLVIMVITRQLYVSRFGELLVAVRDEEERVRFLGYNPAMIKTAAYVIAAVYAGIGGALFVPLVGIISPNDVGVAASIAFIIGVAIGGRSTLLGPLLGAIAVSFAESQLASAFPSVWVYFQGLLFILVIGFLPGGIASIWGVVRARRREAAGQSSPGDPDGLGDPNGPGDPEPTTEPDPDSDPSRKANR